MRLALVALPELIVRVQTRIDVADHVEVIVVDVDDFDGVFVLQLMRNRPANIGDFREVDRTLVVSMMELSGADGGDESRRIDVIGDLLFDDSHVVPLLFVQVGQSTFDRTCPLHRSQHFIIAGRVKSDGRPACGKRPKNRNGVIPLVNPELVFLLILEIRTYRNRNGHQPKVGSRHADAARAT